MMMSFHHSNLAVSPFGRRMRINFLQRRNFFLEFLLSSLSMLCVLGTALPQHTAAALLSRVWNNAERFQGRRVLKDEQRKDFYFDSKVVHFFLCLAVFLFLLTFPVLGDVRASFAKPNSHPCGKSRMTKSLNWISTAFSSTCDLLQ